MELGGGGGGESAAKRSRLSSGDADSAPAAAGEDRLSALPDDILVLILRRLGTCVAARTSVLSRRWRRVWALLPALCFVYAPDLRQIGSALEAHEAALLSLCVWTQEAAPDSMSAWLPVAARRLSGSLYFVNDFVRERGGEEEAVQRAAFELPCLDRATNVYLLLGFLGLAVPPAGVFARLTSLSLTHVRLCGLGDLGDNVSSPRCSCLQKLTVSDARGLDNLAIHSDSLRQLQLTDLHGLRQLNIVAPALKELKVAHCLTQPVASITAPQLATLRWIDPYDPSSVHLGEMRHLRLLRPFYFVVYRDDSYTHNQSCLSLLQRFKVIEQLILTLNYVWGDTTCPPGCICGEHQNWETEHLVLKHLKEVEITHMRGSEHEVTFVKQLFIWGTALEKMVVFLDKSVTESMAKELSQVLRSFARPEIIMEIHTYMDMLVMGNVPED